MMGGDGRATLGGIFSLWVLYRYLSWGGRVSQCLCVSPCLDSSRLDTASACNGLVDPGQRLEMAAEGESRYRPGQCEMRS